MRRFRLCERKLHSIVFLAALFSVPVWGADQARPGTINYVEGRVFEGAKQLAQSSVGSASLEAGQKLITGNGKAEVLLTPGAFLRLGADSAATMVSPGLADTEVRVDKGQALVEVTDIRKENRLLVDENGASTRILKKGLYEFDAGHRQVRVFKGQASVLVDDRSTKLGGGHSLVLTASAKPPKPQRFDKSDYEGSLYRWSSLRSDYISQASADAAWASYYGEWPWHGMGWYWDPWFDAYTFLPGDGILFSPFGWGFYSPWYAWYAPVFYTGYYGGSYAPYGHHPRTFSTFQGRGAMTPVQSRAASSPGFGSAPRSGGFTPGTGSRGGDLDGGMRGGGGFGDSPGGMRGGAFGGGESHGGGRRR